MNDAGKGAQRINSPINDWHALVYGALSNAWSPVKARKGLALIVFLAVAAFFIVGAVRSSYSYSASATLLVSPPAYLTVGPASELMPQPLDIPSYAQLLQDDAILYELAQKAYEEEPRLWQKMHDSGTFVPATLRRMTDVETEIIEKTPQEIRYSRTLVLSAVASTPEQAKHLVDVWTQVSVDAVREFGLPGSEATVTFIREEFDKAKKELETKEEALRLHQIQWNTPLLEHIKESRETQLAELKTELVTVQVDLAENQSALDEVRAFLTEETEIKTLKRFPSNDAIAILQDQGKPIGKDVLSFTDEILNQIWVSTRTKEADLSSKVEGLAARKNHIQKEIAALEKEIDRINEQFVTQRLKETQLEREASSAEEYFRALAKQREEVASIDAHNKLEKAGAITIANAAVLPTEPVNQVKRWSWIPIGLLVALFAAVAAANLAYELDRARGKA
jgi:uncharacterized protein involved in exopolysaccharide biosynthesis